MNITINPTSHFKVSFNKVQNKILFSNSQAFSINFHNNYEHCNFNNNNLGLLSNLGFNNKTNIANKVTEDYYLNYDFNINDPARNSIANTDEYLLISEKCANLFGESNFYMEIDKYNSYDELYPQPTKTNSYYNNNYNGNNQSAFAKISINNNDNDDYHNKNIMGAKSLYGFTNFEPPLEKLSKFKFTFRYHDGTLVDFNDQPFNFTIEINCLNNEISKCYSVRTPELL